MSQKKRLASNGCRCKLKGARTCPTHPRRAGDGRKDITVTGCFCQQPGANTCPLHPNRAGDGRQNNTIFRQVRRDGCTCQKRGANVCPCHPQRSNPPSEFGGGKAGRRIAILIERDGPLCHFCGVDLLDYDNVIATADHLVPQAKGGSNLLSNLVACCYVCNHAKNNHTEQEFRRLIAKGALSARIERAQRDVEARLERRRLGINIGGN